MARPNVQDSIDLPIVDIDRSHLAPLSVILVPISRNCDRTTQMTDFGQLYTEMGVDDDLSSAMGTETLADRGLVPPSFDNTARDRTEGLEIGIFDHRG